MNRLTIKLTSELEDIKPYMKQILDVLVEHEEINGYLILETKGVDDDNTKDISRNNRS